MTRPHKLIQASVEEQMEYIPSKLVKRVTLIEKVYSWMRKQIGFVTTNDVQDAVYPDGSRRHLEKVMTRLVKMRVIERERCVCKCSYVYKWVGKK